MSVSVPRLKLSRMLDWENFLGIRLRQSGCKCKLGLLLNNNSTRIAVGLVSVVL